MKILSEYHSSSRRAKVCVDHTGLYWVIGSYQGQDQISREFKTEYSAEDFAEDWVLQP